MFRKTFLSCFAALIALGLSASALAEVPGQITYHGFLKDDQDQPVTRSVTAVFALYDADEEGDKIWDQTFSTIDVNDGEFSVDLGDNSHEWLDLFDGRRFWLDITINGETLEPRAELTSVPYALRAASASSLNGMSAEALVDELDELKAELEALREEQDNYITSSDLDDALENYASKSSVEALEEKTAPMTRQTLDEEDSIVFEGVNIHLRNGSSDEKTQSTNGVGNLIIGYNEHRGQTTPSERSGSHNLVVGQGHSWTSFGGQVVGRNNTISRDFASVCGGEGNQASGMYSTVSGGSKNHASSSNSSVSGGYDNEASGAYSSVSGGASREAPSMSFWRGGQYSSNN